MTFAIVSIKVKLNEIYESHLRSFLHSRVDKRSWEFHEVVMGVIYCCWELILGVVGVHVMTQDTVVTHSQQSKIDAQRRSLNRKNTGTGTHENDDALKACVGIPTLLHGLSVV